MSASIKKKPKSDKTNETTIFSVKNKYVKYFWAQQNLKWKSNLDKKNFENDPLDEPKKMQSSIFSGSPSKTQNGDQNGIYPSLSLSRLQNFSL